MEMSGIKSRIAESLTEACGYSPLTKVISEEEVNRILAEEEKTGGWIPVTERLPEDDKYIMISFKNFTLPDIGRYEADKDGNEKKGRCGRCLKQYWLWICRNHAVNVNFCMSFKVSRNASS